jgi:hypothetical protein
MIILIERIFSEQRAGMTIFPTIQEGVKVGFSDDIDSVQWPLYSYLDSCEIASYLLPYNT